MKENKILTKVLNSGKALNKTQREFVIDVLTTAYDDKKKAIKKANQELAEKKFSTELTKLCNDFNKKLSIIDGNLRKTVGKDAYVNLHTHSKWDRLQVETLSYNIAANTLVESKEMQEIPKRIKEIELELVLGVILKDEVFALSEEINNIK